ncbi:MAG: NAD(P)/FAD-dependent oxidoreductase [Bacteroidales bacterium]|nr:NAD(P)/FAD-dependent oxidoreductase [Bacteroidales bacterium]
MDFDIVVIGAGVVGLAIAAELSKTYSNLVVLEKNEKFGQETSSRNSEVIHSGIYYPQNSLKAILCVQGNKLIYDYCEKNEVPHKKCGKYIIATDEVELKKLDDILENAKKNGVEDARKISIDELKNKEPNVNAIGALYFPNSGIVDSHSLMKSLEREIFINKAQIVYNSEVIGIFKIDEGYKITIKEENSTFSFSSKIIINAAGLNADKISFMAGIINPEYNLHYWKGEYFSVGNGKNKLVNSLIYPVPNQQVSLGIHATIDINRGLKLGPNAVFLDKKKIDYSVNKDNLKEFYDAAKRFFPFLNINDLHADQLGIRPKLTNNAKEFKDFIILNEQKLGFDNFINLIGIESPGLTACLSIAKHVKRIIC